MCKSEIFPEIVANEILNHNVRFDGRDLRTIRSPVVQPSVLSNSIGSSIVSSGQTVFLCGVSAEIGPPTTYAPNSGRIVANVEFPQLCDKECKYEPQINMCINKILSKPGVIDLQQLCIKENVAVWTLYVNAVCLSYDGNGLDWSLLACVTALLNTRLPSISWDPVAQWWRTADVGGSVPEKPILFSNIPVATTLAQFSQGKWVVDPTFQEEQYANMYSIWRAGNSSDVFTMHSNQDECLTTTEIQSLVQSLSDQIKDVLKQFTTTISTT